MENQLPQTSVAKIRSSIIKLSVITRIELLSWSDVAHRQLQTLQNFIAVAIVYDLDEAIIIETIDIRKQYRIKLPDAIIAATAIVNNLTLITRNIPDFRRISELDILNPF